MRRRWWTCWARGCCRSWTGTAATHTWARCALRGDGVATHILGMNKVISDDSLRRALGALASEPQARHTEEQRQAQQAQVARSVQWMQQHLRRSEDAALYTPWILDCDTTIKVLYGGRGAKRQAWVRTKGPGTNNRTTACPTSPPTQS